MTVGNGARNLWIPQKPGHRLLSFDCLTVQCEKNGMVAVLGCEWKRKIQYFSGQGIAWPDKLGCEQEIIVGCACIHKGHGIQVGTANLIIVVILDTEQISRISVIIGKALKFLHIP